MNRFILAALLPFAAAPAFAGNVAPIPVEPAPIAPAPAPVYEWSGAYIGAQVGFADVEADGAIGVDDDGFLAGLRAGYDLDLGGTVVGGLVQYDSGSYDLAPSGIEVDDIVRVGGRVGYDLGRTLFYGLGGYTSASTNVAGDADGYFLGIGTETFITENVTFGVETIYHDFGDLDGAPNVDLEAATLGVNLNFRF